MAIRARPPNAKRLEIADAARPPIGRRGSAAPTVASPAEELGLSPGAPVRPFASRDQLQDAVAGRGEEIPATRGSESIFCIGDLLFPVSETWGVP